jgi:hypothetical protein
MKLSAKVSAAALFVSAMISPTAEVQGKILADGRIDRDPYPCAPPSDVVDSRVVGRGGGALRAGRHRVVVPPDAIPGSARLTLREHAGSFLVVSVHPPGLAFQRNVEIVLSTARCGPLSQPPTGAMRFTPATGWRDVPADRLTIRPGEQPGEFEVVISSDGFSSYALIAP